MKFLPARRLAVSLNFEFGQPEVPVGTMLKTSDGKIHFEFAQTFLGSGLEISPIRLPLSPGVKRTDGTTATNFDGVFGVFADSLPDGWGLLLMSRQLRKAGLRYEDMTTLDRLSYVGTRGMGALVYRPEFASPPTETPGSVDLSVLAEEAERVLQGEEGEVLRVLAAVGGTAGGARPKVLIGINSDQTDRRVLSGVHELPKGFEHWIVKFRGKEERQDAGIVEWAYAQTAIRVGLHMEPSRLFVEDDVPWFGTRRFDRGAGGSRLHMHTACGMLHAYFREPSLDYETLLKVVSAVTRRADDLHSAFRLAVFNVVFHNRDDHAKNFSFLMNKDGEWRLAPVYDLTFNFGPGGEHSTAILGEGRSPTREHLLRLAIGAGISVTNALEIIDEVESGRPFLLDLLRQHGVAHHPIQELFETPTRHLATHSSQNDSESHEQLGPQTLRECAIVGCTSPVGEGRKKYCAEHGLLSDSGKLTR